MSEEKQIDIKGMRAYEELSDITLPVEQEEMMDIICDAWQECRKSDCKVCTDRPNKYMRIMACTAVKYTRLLREAGYRKQSEGEWVDQYQGKYDNQLYKCSECGETAFHDESRWFLTHYCPNCGAKMKGGAE